MCIRDSPYPGHLVRIDADGYKSAKSRVFESSEGSVAYDFRLKKGSGPGGVVYEPNGFAAEGAEIYVVREHYYLNLENGKPSNRPQDDEWAVTDEDGSFSFKGVLEDSSYKLVVIHDQGFAEISKEQWLEDPNIWLQEWGRVEGTLYSGLGVGANQEVHYYSVDSQNNPERMNYSYSITVNTDEEGQFAIERVIPGRAAVARRFTSDDGRRRSYIGTEYIDIYSGEAVNVEIGGGGRIVRGRLIKPEWAEGTTGLKQTNPRINPAQVKKLNPFEVVADLEFPWPQNFDSMTVSEVLRWFEQWYKSDEGAAFREEVKKRTKELQPEIIHYGVIVESDGSFRIFDVLPGEYIFSVALRQADSRGNPDYQKPIVAEIKHKFTVGDITEENENIAVDLGRVEFFEPAKFEPNQPVPDFSVRSLEGGTLSLGDFRGKYVLLTFYMITGQENMNEEWANLREIQDDFAGDERFVMVGLTTGGMPLYEELAKKFIAEQGLTWEQGILDGSNYELVEIYKVRNFPHSFLIDRNGLLIVDDLKGDELYEAVAEALAE